MNDPQSRALTEREVAARLGLSVATLRTWRMRHTGPRFVRLGRAVRYLENDIDEYVGAHAVDPKDDRSSVVTSVGKERR